MRPEDRHFKTNFSIARQRQKNSLNFQFLFSCGLTCKDCMLGTVHRGDIKEHNGGQQK